MPVNISSGSIVLTAVIKVSMFVQLFNSGGKLFQIWDGLGKNNKCTSQFEKILYDTSGHNPCLVCLVLIGNWSVGMSIKFSRAL